MKPATKANVWNGYGWMNASSSSLEKKYESTPARALADKENINALGNADPYILPNVLSPHHPLSYRIIAAEYYTQGL